MMKAAYNIDLNVVIYPTGMSGELCESFPLSVGAALAIAPELGSMCEGKTRYPLDYVDITFNQFVDLGRASDAENYYELDGCRIPRGTPMEIALVLVEAAKKNQPVMIEYAKGCEVLNQSGIHDDTGRVHMHWMGTQTCGNVTTLRYLPYAESIDHIDGRRFVFKGIDKVEVLPSGDNLA
jgi:hypothetical protein